MISLALTLSLLTPQDPEALPVPALLDDRDLRRVQEAHLQLIRREPCRVPSAMSMVFTRTSDHLVICDTQLRSLNLQTGEIRSAPGTGQLATGPGGDQVLLCEGDSIFIVNAATLNLRTYDLAEARSRCGDWPHRAALPPLPAPALARTYLTAYFTSGGHRNPESPGEQIFDSRWRYGQDLRLHPDGQHLVVIVGLGGGCGMARPSTTLTVYEPTGDKAFETSGTSPLTADFNHDARLLVWAGPRDLRLLRTSDYSEIRVRNHPVRWWRFIDPVLALSHDGREITFWHGPELEPVKKIRLGESPLQGPGAARIDRAVLSPDKRRLAVVTRGEVTVYDIVR